MFNVCCRDELIDRTLKRLVQFGGDLEGGGLLRVFVKYSINHFAGSLREVM